MGKLIITGADGFIGSHLTEKLVLSGYEVKAFVQYNSMGTAGWLDNCPEQIKGKFEIVSGDIRDPNGIKNAMKGCDTVLHLAALIAIPFSYQSPDSYVDTNIKGTLNVLQSARDLDISVIQTSTSEVYGTALYVPIDEKHPLRGQSPYSATKIAADQLAFSFFTSFELPVTILRPFNTYGPRQSARAVIPTIISQIASGSAKINLGSLHPTRDFNFVEDTVEGFIKSINNKKAVGRTINIASNFEISIGEILKLIASLMGEELSIEIEEQRLRPQNSEVERLWGENKKALELLDWSPKYSGVDGLEKGLRKTIEWFSKDENLSFYKPQRYIL